MKKMNSGKENPTWCLFSNNRSRSVLRFLKLWVQEEKCRVLEEEAIK